MSNGLPLLIILLMFSSEGQFWTQLRFLYLWLMSRNCNISLCFHRLRGSLKVWPPRCLCLRSSHTESFPKWQWKYITDMFPSISFRFQDMELTFHFEVAAQLSILTSVFVMRKTTHSKQVMFYFGDFYVVSQNHII